MPSSRHKAASVLSAERLAKTYSWTMTTGTALDGMGVAIVSGERSVGDATEPSGDWVMTRPWWSGFSVISVVPHEPRSGSADGPRPGGGLPGGVR